VEMSKIGGDEKGKEEERKEKGRLSLCLSLSLKLKLTGDVTPVPPSGTLIFEGSLIIASPCAMSLVAIVPRRALVVVPPRPLRLRRFFWLFVVLVSFVEVGSAPAGESATRPTRTSECPPDARIQAMRADPVASASSSVVVSCFLACETARKRTRSKRKRARRERW